MGGWYQKLEHEMSVVSGYRFETSLIKVVITTLLVIAFVLLGVWQLNRAKEKQEHHDEFLARAELPQVIVQDELLDSENMEFRSARATGRYLVNYQILLDNNVYRGRAGYHVLTPLLLVNTTTVLLVNRGWIPWGLDRQKTPTVDVPTKPVVVKGRLVQPAKHALDFEGHEAQIEFQKVWQNLDLEKFERLTGYATQRLVMLLDPNSEADGFIRDWPVYRDTWVQRHRGYAVQWFALALALLCIFLFLSFKRNR